MSTPQKFRKKPVEIEAMQWDGTASGATPIINWILSGRGTARFHSDVWTIQHCGPAIAIDTLEGSIWSSPGDWIIRGIAGEFYPCKPDIFAATYEELT